jgi:hypothetical protein
MLPSELKIDDAAVAAGMTQLSEREKRLRFDVFVGNRVIIEQPARPTRRQFSRQRAHALTQLLRDRGVKTAAALKGVRTAAALKASG